MLYCCECNKKINTSNTIFRCFDSTVCSRTCQLNRCFNIEKIDKKYSKFDKWYKKQAFLINPDFTSTEIKSLPSFLPLYVKSKSDLKKTASFYLNKINDSEDKLKNKEERENLPLEQNEIQLKNNIKLEETIDNLKLLSTNYYDNSCNIIDTSYNIVSNGFVKIYDYLFHY